MVEHLAVGIRGRDLLVAVVVMAALLEAVTRVALLVVEVDPVEVALLVAVVAPVLVTPAALQVVEVVSPVVPLAVVMAAATLALVVQAMASLAAQVDAVEVLVEAEALQVRRILAVAVVPCVGDPVAVVAARPLRMI
jgi:hypothetical protein